MTRIFSRWKIRTTNKRAIISPVLARSSRFNAHHSALRPAES